MIKIIILSIAEFDDDVKIFTMTKPENFEFQPGQYVLLNLPNYQPIPIAIASGNLDDPLVFVIRKWGKLTKELFSKSIGDEVLMEGPLGTYFPIEKIDKKLVLIGRGTAIAPLRSLKRSISKEINVSLYYGVKSPQILFHKEINSDFHSKIMELSDKNKMIDILKQNKIATDAVYFVCGPNKMLKAITEYLYSLGISKSQIFVSVEKYDENGNVIGPVLNVNDNIFDKITR